MSATERVARYLTALESGYDEAHPIPAELAVDRATDWTRWLAQTKGGRTPATFDPDERPGIEAAVPLLATDLRELLRLAGWKPPVEAAVAVTNGLTDPPGPPVPTDVVTVYTDGACSHGGVGGWAWWWGPGPGEFDSGAEPFTTNNAMELWAVIAALESDLDHDPLRIVSDSAYVVNGIVHRWYDAWRENGWRNTKKKPVENRELWEELLALIEAHRAPIEWVHIRGHGKVNAAGVRPPAHHIRGNDQADKLAVAARRALAAEHDHRDSESVGGIVIPDGVRESISRSAARSS